jgi:hypothetical protein
MLPRTRAVIGVVSFGLLSCFASCSSTNPKDEPQVLSSTTTKTGEVTVTEEMIGRSRGSMSLSRSATDSSYGYSQALPVKVGGG